MYQNNNALYDMKSSTPQPMVSAPPLPPPQPMVSPPPPPPPQRMVAAPYPVAPAPGQWTTGLFDCCKDPSNCIITCCYPCFTFGQNAEILDRGRTSCASAGLFYFCLGQIGIQCLLTVGYRTKLRDLYSLREDPCADCLVHFCCLACALCQEYRELKNRGLDPSIGWAANAERMNRGAAATPPTVQGMRR